MHLLSEVYLAIGCLTVKAWILVKFAEARQAWSGSIRNQRGVIHEAIGDTARLSVRARLAGPRDPRRWDRPAISGVSQRRSRGYTAGGLTTRVPRLHTRCRTRGERPDSPRRDVPDERCRPLLQLRSGAFSPLHRNTMGPTSSRGSARSQVNLWRRVDLLGLRHFEIAS